MNGHPIEYSDEIANTICERIAGGESLRKICLADDMPAQSTVYKWLLDPAKADFVEQYTRARELQADTLFDECQDIADDGSNDWMADKDAEEGTKYNGDAVQRSRLRIDTRKWMAGKLRPKKYGDKIDLTSDGGALQVNIVRLADADD
ncbi:hypothetical protein [Sphingobium sp. DC-2]|uniref:terminase small subunit-like protein n=1 Tax=Sphingobium sp. DC-2 TaxID=1303256 RepID=UPI0004C32810|nr:hypothetical protein [Sphingobium sp. DC-2]